MKALKSTKPQLKVRKPLLVGLGAVVLAGIAATAWAMTASKTDTSTTVLPRVTSSPSASPTPGSGAGGQEARGANVTPTPAPAAPQATAPQKPIGQVLNTDTISLSATSGPRIPNLESTIIQATTGSTITVVATSGSKTITASQGGTVNADGGLNGPMSWNAKTVGLTPGTWQVKLVSTLNGQASSSDIATLTVQD